MKHLGWITLALAFTVQAHAQNMTGALRAGYGMDDAYYTGNGMTVGIVVNGYFDAAAVRKDLITYSQDAGISAPQLKYVYVGAHPVQGQAADWNTETRIDTQMVHAMAPDAAIVVFIDDGSAGMPLKAVRRAANSGAQVVSMSFGQPETRQATIDQWEAIFANHPEVTFIAGSGDSGSNNGNVAYPASSPSVLAVGGVVDGFGSNPPAWAKSGGGVSTIFGMPDYQSNLPVGNGSGRMVPDVAMNSAGDNARIYSSVVNGYVPVSGTSISAPLMAGMIATVDEAFGGSVGDVHPYIYGAMDAGQQLNYFRDSSRGSNGMYNALPGFDMVTGAGVPSAPQLINLISGQ